MICQLFGNCGLEISQPDPGATLSLCVYLVIETQVPGDVCHLGIQSPPPDVIITAVFSEGLVLPEEAAVTSTSVVPQGR